MVEAIHAGDVPTLRRLLAENPRLATARLGDDDPDGMSRTLLHVATDWPGHYPEVAATVIALIKASTDVNARFRGPHAETPCTGQRAATTSGPSTPSSTPALASRHRGAVIAGGPPLADARAFGNWEAAHRLVERGARTTLTDAATLGLIDRVEDAFATAPPPAPDEINRAFWGACHGGQQRTAAYLIDRGAELNWIPNWEQLTPLDAARRSNALRLADWLRSRDAKSADELNG